MIPQEELMSPYMVLDGAPIYHIGHNPFQLLSEDEFEDWKFRLTKYGEFRHPYLMFGMPDTPGHNAVHVDTSVKGWYILTLTSQLDTWMNGPSYPAKSIWTWTPKQPGDNIYRAGDRLFWAGVLAMDGRERQEVFSRFYDNIDEPITDGWEPSARCERIFHAVRSKDSPIRTGKSFEETLLAF